MRIYAAAALLLYGVLPSPAEILDRIVLVVAHHPITELQLEEEVRITAFLNEQPLSTDLAQRRQAADRLIDQALVQREMGLTRFPPPTEEDADSALAKLEAEQGGEDHFAQTLARYQLTAAEVRTHLAVQIATLRFLAFRFRPELGVQEAAVRQAYEKEKASWSAEHPGQPPPSFEASRSSLRLQLQQQETDADLAEWLQQARKQVRLTYLDHSLEMPLQ